MKIQRLIGIGMMAAVMPATAADAAKPSAANKTLSSDGGRYVFGQVSEYRRDQFMLDTKTGQLWQIAERNLKFEDGTTETILVLQQIRYAEPGGRLTKEPPATK